MMDTLPVPNHSETPEAGQNYLVILKVKVGAFFQEARILGKFEDMLGGRRDCHRIPI